ncbi:heterocyst frequency control protein PatD [Oscillatoria sp. CS-180]|uniref:heterocyst frequency control protein PatD n=1 Tax=Oscillatoria sp. CS-180 TaxID=3021720 RepID=UPI00232DAAAC|nr:heterocyst frequency control protein PatD [Oscillatoria sp. CS-180]MDB9525072.1 heterocyst frequency control protein PatD [Oscillatoria sp. CS-180]
MSDPQSPAGQAEDLLAAFIAALTNLQTEVSKSTLDGRSLQQQFLATQQLYQQQLLPTLALSPSAAALVGYQTEISRALRLLGMDVAFLQSAKNALTQQKRQVQMQERLKTLLDFGRGLQDAFISSESDSNGSDS